MLRLMMMFLMVGILGTRSGLARTEFRLSGADWKITLPKGWETISTTDLEKVNATARQALSTSKVNQGVRYVCGFRPSTPDGSYVLVQLLPSPPAGARFDAISASIAESVRSDFANLKDIPFESVPTIHGDAPANRVIARSIARKDIADGLSNMSTWNLGSDNIVVLHAYAPGQDFPRLETGLRGILDSIVFDGGKVYAYGSKSINTNPKKAFASTVVTHTIQGAICGTLFGIGLWIIKRLRGT